MRAAQPAPFQGSGGGLHYARPAVSWSAAHGTQRCLTAGATSKRMRQGGSANGDDLLVARPASALLCGSRGGSPGVCARTSARPCAPLWRGMWDSGNVGAAALLRLGNKTKTHAWALIMPVLWLSLLFHWCGACVLLAELTVCVRQGVGSCPAAAGQLSCCRSWSPLVPKRDRSCVVKAMGLARPSLTWEPLARGACCLPFALVPVPHSEAVIWALHMHLESAAPCRGLMIASAPCGAPRNHWGPIFASFLFIMPDVQRATALSCLVH